MYFNAKGAIIMPFDASFFDAGPDRSGTASVKWSQPGFCPEGHIPLWVADMDFACAPAITEALVNRAGHPSYGYTYTGDEDRQAFCAWWQRRHGVSLKTSDIGLLPSVVSGLRVGVEEFTKPGEGVIIQPPVYGPFYASIEDAGRNSYHFPERPTAEDVLNGIDSKLTIDPWADQDTYVEVWVEEQALEATIARPCSRLNTPYMACKGYLSASEAWRASLNAS